MPYVTPAVTPDTASSSQHANLAARPRKTPQTTADEDPHPPEVCQQKVELASASSCWSSHLFCNLAMVDVVLGILREFGHTSD